MFLSIERARIRARHLALAGLAADVPDARVVHAAPPPPPPPAPVADRATSRSATARPTTVAAPATTTREAGASRSSPGTRRRAISGAISATRWRWLAAAGLAACAVGGAPTAASAAAPPPTAPKLVEPLAPCDLEGAGPRARCGSVDVPLDRSDPSRGTTRIGFVLVARRDQGQPSLGTVVPNPGGPGDPAIGDLGYAALLAPLLDRRELLLVDPRGVGRSSPPPKCRSLEDPAVGFSRAKLVAAFGACGHELGPKAGLYGSAAVADDIDDVRAALGLDRLDLWGDSYGTYLMTVYAARHAEHVRSVVLSGSYPIAFDTFGRDRLGAALRAIRLICDRTRSCDGDAVLGDLTRVAAHLRQRPVPFTVAAGKRRFRATLDERTLASVVYNNGSAELSAALPPTLASAAAGDLDPLKRLVSQVALQTAALAGSETFVAPTFAAVMCHDYPRAFGFTDAPAARRAAYRQALAALPPGDFGPFSAAGWASAGFEGGDACLDWPSDPTAGSPLPAGSLLPDLPVLVLTGDLDANTPSEAGRESAAQFPHAILAEVANSGHTPTGDRCARALGIAFVETLAADPSRCATTGTPPAVPARSAVHARHLTPVRASATDGVRRALAVVLATVEDLGQQYGNARGWGSADGLRGGRYVVDARGTARLDDVRVVRDARISGRIVPSPSSFAGELRLSGPGVPSGTLRVRISPRTGAGHASGRLDGRPVDVAFRAGGDSGR